MLNHVAILKDAGKIYARRKRNGNHPHSPPPEIQSDQVKALCEAMCNALNEELQKIQNPLHGFNP